ncbi:MAG: TatD family hydrolase [Candidatus Pacebacteria bacterium]|nr:TatD family hydrolase [Candidatus Paceibacterota bacterium]
MQKAIRYIDTHGHINLPDYGTDRQEVIARAAQEGVGIITVGVDIESSKRAIELAEAHENMWAVVGIHPTEVKTADVELDQDEEDFQELRRFAVHPKVVAIGECGLEYFQTKEADIPAQVEAFEEHIAIANEAKKPLMLHVRNGKKKGDVGAVPGDAYKDALKILKKSAKVPFDFHFFAGTIEDMHQIFALGGTASFTGVLTFTHDYDELIKAAPIGSIMSETDCPYVSPVPYRGKRNEPAYVVEVVKTIARIRGEDEETIRAKLLENARKFFHLG